MTKYKTVDTPVLHKAINSMCLVMPYGEKSWPRKAALQMSHQICKHPKSIAYNRKETFTKKERNSEVSVFWDAFFLILTTISVPESHGWQMAASVMAVPYVPLYCVDKQWRPETYISHKDNHPRRTMRYRSPDTHCVGIQDKGDRADSRFVPRQWEMPLLCHDASHWLGTSLESASTRYVDGTPTSEVTSVTIRYIHPPHHGHTSQYHGHEWMTHILFVHCQSAAPFLR